MNEKKNEIDNDIIIEEESAATADEQSEKAAGEEVLFSEDDAAAKIAELEEKLKAERERLLRTAADLDNLRKRSRREIDDALIRGRADVLREILPVMDSIDSALKNADPDGPASGVLTGVEMVRKQFLAVTAQFGLELVASEGKPFDPYFHEAVAQIESADHEPGQVIQEMRPGYLLGDRLIRASMVVVCQGTPSRAPAEATASANNDSESQAPAEASETSSDTPDSSTEENEQATEE